MPGRTHAPLVHLDDAAETDDTYVFFNNKGYGGQGAGAGSSFSIGDTGGNAGEPDDTSRSDFYGVFTASPDRTSFGALLNADGADGSVRIGSTDAPATVDFDDVVDPDGTGDALFL